MIKGGGGMSHRRHRLVRGEVDRKKVLQQLAREANQKEDEKRKAENVHKEPTFDSVSEAFEASRKRR